MSVRVSMREGKAPKRSLMFTVHHHGTRYRLALGLSLESNFWDAERERVKPLAPMASKLNLQIEEARQRVEALLLRAKGENIAVTQTSLEEAIVGQRRGTAKTFWEQVSEYIQTLHTPGRWNTVLMYRALMNSLYEFEQSRKITLTWEMMDKRLFDQLRDYLNHHRRNTNVTVLKKLSRLRTLCRWAHAQGYTQNEAWKDYKLAKGKASRKTKVYFTAEELCRIECLHINPDSKPGLYIARLRLLMECYTGLRISDVEQLKPDMIKRKGRYLVLDLKTIKTGTDIVIPFTDRMRSVFEELLQHRGNITNQVLNRQLKKLAEMAEINAPIRVVTYRGSQRSEVLVPKYQLVSSHIGRRTFGTLWAEKGGRLEVLQRIYGHSTLKQTLDYIILTDDSLVAEFQRIAG